MFPEKSESCRQVGGFLYKANGGIGIINTKGHLHNGLQI